MAKKRGKAKASNSTITSKSATNIKAVLDTEAILAAAFNAANQTVLLKVCRLCEAKDGPFLNIFGAENNLAKKIDDLLPFVVKEDDELPHKVCFRCSAKVEELHDFIQKCIKCQENLETMLGKKGSYISKTNTRKIWEDKLTKSNMTNDIICDAVIKRAMEGIQGIPSQGTEQQNCRLTIMKDAVTETEQETEDTTTEGEVKCAKITQKRKHTRNNNTEEKTGTVIANELPSSVEIEAKKLKSKKIITNPTEERSSNQEVLTSELTIPPNNEPAPEKPAFDIMAHVNIIKVNGVGILFQCKLCNRNFLNKSVVLSHACAKSGIPKVDFSSSIVQLEPIKVQPTNIQYITQEIPEVQNPEKKETAVNLSANVVCKPGPASKKKKLNSYLEESPKLSNSPLMSSLPTVEVAPSVTGLKSHYKLLPGPHNTFTLIEHTDNTNPPTEISKSNYVKPYAVQSKPKSKKMLPIEQNIVEVIDLDDDVNEPQPQSILPTTSTGDKPYPVGLFQAIIPRGNMPPSPPPMTFTTPTIKKQSYTVVQTGNPSKLLISAKPQPSFAPEAEVPVTVSKSKRGRKKKQVAQTKEAEEEAHKATLQSLELEKEGSDNFFTFINVGPLLQPSYVLPTDSIQESQISTSNLPQASSSKGKKDFSCDMCDMKFTREKTLLSHVQIHFDKVEEEDKNQVKHLRKRTRKS